MIVFGRRAPRRLLMVLHGPSQRLLFPGESELPYGILLSFNNLGDTLGVVASIAIVELVGRRGSLALGFFGQATFLSLLVGACRDRQRPRLTACWCP